MSNIIHDVYYVLILLAVAGFAVYDVKTKRVPDKALVFFLPAALAAPVINAFAYSTGPIAVGSFVLPLVSSFAGALLGAAVLLAAALISKNGCGVGGGDIKLAAILGFIYGPFDAIGFLLVASLLALLVGLARMKKADEQALNMAFVPFMAAGCLLVTVFRLL